MLRTKGIWFKLILSGLLLMVSGLLSDARAVVSSWTAANTILANHFALTYKNVVSFPLPAVSSEVDSMIQKRARVEVTPDSQTVFQSPGETVYISHTLKNIGNAGDTFYFVSSSAQGWEVEIIGDSNQDGVRQADEDAPISSTEIIPQNDTYSFFISAHIPDSIAQGVIDTVTTKVVSGYEYPDTFLVIDTIRADSPPAAPAGLKAEHKGEYIYLHWSANLESDIAGYHIYKSINGGTYTKINDSVEQGTEYTDTALVYPNDYYYKVSAIDSVSQESSFSDSAWTTALSLQKKVEVLDYHPGGKAIYTIEVKNIGYAPARDIELSDTIPKHTTFDTAVKAGFGDTIAYSADKSEWHNSPEGIRVQYIRWQFNSVLDSGDTAVVKLQVIIK